ncbi:MAG: PilZ domain-containing protein [Spirochaetia bacterium]|nr:PilZ domain-containing protein [Spirochaetia bacterium]
MGESTFNDSLKIRDPSQQKRKKARTAVNIPCEFKLAGQTDFLECLLTDVGAGGVSIVTKSSLYVGDKVDVQFKMGHSPFRALGSVVRVIGKSVGLQFDSLPDGEVHRLQEFIHQAFKDRDRKKP